MILWAKQEFVNSAAAASWPTCHNFWCGFWGENCDADQVMGLTTLIFTLAGQRPCLYPCPSVHLSVRRWQHIRIPVRESRVPRHLATARPGQNCSKSFYACLPTFSSYVYLPAQTDTSFHSLSYFAYNTPTPFQQIKLSACVAKVGECDDKEGVVCGTDGQTYPTRCHLLRAQCWGQEVSFKYQGSCKGKLEDKCDSRSM